MLSHLRFHRRGSSNPTSPIAEQVSPRDMQKQQQQQQHQHQHQQQQQQLDGILSPDLRPSSSSSPTLPSLPPTLPPISTSSDPSFDLPDFSSHTPQTELPRGPPLHQTREPQRQETTPFSRDPTRDHPRPAPMKSPYNQDTGFIGGVALQKYRRAEEAARRQEPPDVQTSDTQHPPNPSRTVPLSTSSSVPTTKKPSTSFVTPTDLRNSGASPTGRMSSSNVRGPEPFPHAVVVSPMEPSRAKKGLPFLKNPMSTLLMRRKAVQNVTDLLPARRTAEPEYDPRIRGTRVHDFSAPRPRKPAPQAAPRDPSTVPQHRDAKPPPTPDKSRQRPSVEATTTEDTGQSNLNPGRQVSSGTDSAHLTASTRTDTPSTQLNDASSVRSNPSLHPSLDKPLPTRASSPPIVPPKDNASTATTRSSAASTAAQSSIRSGPGPNRDASTRSARSGGRARIGILSRESFSSIPKHMKSTSSRFSFDMIGAAKQEKLLEERHRQRQLELGTATGPADGSDYDYRDSRFDDLDEFDYDAMMHDDGLEEPIPGVNADYDEEPIPGMEDDYEEPIPGVNIDDGEEEFNNYGGTDDPDDDQENFAGFVFERSPLSGLPSPNSAGLMVTPQDADGKVIGFALSQELPLDQLPSPVPEPLSLDRQDADEDLDLLPGLGIQHHAVPDRTVNTNSVDKPTELLVTNGLPREGDGRDELYFDDGMIGFDGEFADELDFSAETDEEPFNEALFDLNDTDQYGRPIPGAFKAAKEAYATRHHQDRRESDGTSGQFDQSIMSPSTTRTSISAPGLPHAVSKVASEEISPEQRYGTASQMMTTPGTEADTMAAYQAALAAAAHQAAAEGKFRRDSSSPRSPDLSPPEARPVSSHDLDDYDEPSDLDFDDYEKDDMLDFDLDDDDIIAEANASALANDSEGWYGHEFGFYSAPTAQGGTLPFEYSNGGYFGPSGQGAGAGGGRAVSREPNLTPITERSEYSNRNSIMSLGVPPLGSGASTSLQSPGLAQLVMMADGGGDDNMTLSALLRLRSKAWGGSQASLASSRDGSPWSEKGGDGGSSPQQQLGVGGHHVRKGSCFSALSREGTHSLSGSPTLTGPGLMMSSPGGQNGSTVQVPASLANGTAQSPVLSSSCGGSSSPCEGRNPEGRRGAMKGHRHKGSAGSISYVREEEGGETRWVVERQIIGESGEEEILEREVLEGVRI